MKDRGECYGMPTVRGPLFEAGPFDGSPNTPTPDEVLVGGLIWRHTGRANPISIAHILIQDGADQAAAVGPYRSQILSMWKRLRVLEGPQGLRELLGQLRLED
jgi:hypothetical protein